MEKLRELFIIYYNSYPSELWVRSRRKHRFIARDPDEMSDMELAVGADRTEAERELNDYVDESIKNGTLTWEWGNQWFHKDEEMPMLILLKDWFEKEKRYV